MSEIKKNRRFYLPLIVISLLIGLILILPQFPQSSLRESLTSKFTQVLRQPCQLQTVSLQLVPCPAIVVHGFTTVESQLSLKAKTVFLDLNLLSLLRADPEIIGVRLQGMILNTTFKYIKDQRGDTADAVQTSSGSVPVSLSSLAAIIRDQGLPLKYVTFNDAVCTLTEISGYKNPLLFTDLSGSWNLSARNASEKLALSGACGGGRGDLNMTWYQVGAAAAGAEKSGDRLEISCIFDGISIPGYEMVSLAGSNRNVRTTLKNVYLKLDINGDPQSGLRFTTQFTADDHTVAIYDVISDVEKLCSQGPVKASLNGFFQPHDGYVNLKSASLEYPHAATLFYRGLVRFQQSLFVDLVSELKVDDLTLLGHSLPLLAWPGYQVAGQLSGQLKLVGNPKSAPVLQVELKSEKIALHKIEGVPAALSGDGTVSPTGKNIVKSSSSSSSSGFDQRFFNLVKGVADWEWLLKSDCRITTLELPGLIVSNLSLLAEKSLTRLEIERLTAHFGKSGRLRLSLVLENLLHEPRWQASLIAEKFYLKSFRKTFLVDGILDASLVGGGVLASDSELVQGLDLHGKWNLRQGAFVNYPLFNSFTDFLAQKGRTRLGTRFAAFSGKFALRDKVLQLDRVKLISGGNQVNGGGRFFVTDKNLQLSGQFIPKKSSSLSFKITGDTENPIFKASGR